MAYYKTCDICGASLDPGEKCTCEEEAREEALNKEIQKRTSAFIYLNTCGRSQKTVRKKS